MKKLFLLAILLMFPITVFSATYEVDDDGGGDYTTIAQANAVAVSGDIVSLNCGDTFNEQVVPISGVTYNSYGTGEDPIISGAGLSTAVVLIVSKSDITFKDIRITGGTNIYGVFSFGGDNITFDGVTVDNCRNGIWFDTNYGADADTVSNILIKNCSINTLTEYDYARGIRFYAGDASHRDSYIRDITIQDTDVYDCTYGISISSRATTMALNEVPSGITIQRCNVYSNTQYGLNLKMITDEYATQYIGHNNVYDNGDDPHTESTNGLWLGAVWGATIENNVCYNNNTGGIDGVGIYLDYNYLATSYNCQRCIVRYNLCYNHDDCKDQVPYDSGTGETSGNSAGINVGLGSDYNEVYSNICYNNTVGIIVADTNTTYNEIYHNTLNGNRIGMQLHCKTSVVGNVIKNNIISNNNKTGDGLNDTWGIYNEGIDITNSNYNIIYNNGVDYYNHTEGNNTILSDPLVNSTGFPYTNSPAIDTGIDIGVTTDYRGISRSSLYDGDLPDIGAYERKKNIFTYTGQNYQEWNETMNWYRDSQ